LSIAIHTYQWILLGCTKRQLVGSICVGDDDPYEELLHNVDEVETLLQDPVVLAAIHRLLDPDADLDEL